MVSFKPPAKYKAVAVTSLGVFETIEKEWRDPGPGEIAVKVLACGVCRSDDFIKQQIFPTGFPRVPGHEVIGDCVAVHPSEKLWKVGDRVGTGWHGGQCNICDRCRIGDVVTCVNEHVNGISADGGWAEYVILKSEGIARIPKDLDPVEAAPLLCAGVTTYNAIRHMDRKAGDVAAVQGIGGLGHLAVQYCRAMGFRTIALSSGAGKAEVAQSLGAHAYLDGSKVNQAEELQKMGGADLLVLTAPFPEAMASLIMGMKPGGTILILALTADTINLPIHILVPQKLSVRGWKVGSPKDCEDTVRFSQMTGVKAQVQKFSLDDAVKAFNGMMDGSVKFRAVIVP
ncbi:zinc-type alcohol dehydrogenase [Gloeophyllum trabeum ATCC 11539]|uniref:Zinc-type alcohol dehydrogenase n=1 Tax=Gloeophyllum trabeum (strain ATCC 11539 / FP-39264 / Madison 617) TaxID=670483 RepID=S7RW10_GLOTA|nr:zinc-type alcohol dehydrogenase [Gloeophyllum trabeum ATCC 11539]EPQ59025.1 zinc-type alcohol dehydrogenase [Gloeophyllum trabeum ATCC 11539]